MYKNAIRNNFCPPITYKIIKNDKGQVITTSIKKQGLKMKEMKRHWLNQRKSVSHESYKIKDPKQRKLYIGTEDIIYSSDKKNFSSDESDTVLDVLVKENSSCNKEIQDYISSSSSSDNSSDEMSFPNSLKKGKKIELLPLPKIVFLLLITF